MPRNPLHQIDCPACGAPCGRGRRSYDGKAIIFDLRTEIYALIGNGPVIDLTLTSLAVVEHQSVCPYKDV
jgi:hypothetical protein